MMKVLQSLAILFSLFPPVTFAWTTSKFNSRSLPQLRQSQDCYNTALHLQSQPEQDRRSFAKLSAAVAFTTLVFPSFTPPPASAAVAADISFDKLSIDDAKKRFQLARQDLKYLLEHYNDISKKGGGDAVRNYLGTQGINSNMYGIQKILKRLQEESNDIVEYTETMDEFNAYYYQAEGAAYQSMFAEHSSAKATPESLLATAKKDIEQMITYMDQLATQLNL